jgi:hypothetical protein
VNEEREGAEAILYSSNTRVKNERKKNYKNRYSKERIK